LDNGHHDRVFFKTFALVLGALFGIFILCIIAASIVAPVQEAPPELAVKLKENVAPVAKVVTDPAALVKVTEEKPARAPYTGEEVVAKVCNACHQAGVLGAPKEGDKAAWSARLASGGGVDGLVKSAISGKNSMPPRGGDSSLSDDEVKAAVQVLLKTAGL